MDGHQNLAAVRDQPRLLDQVRGVIRRLHYSIRTEQTYVDWIHDQHQLIVRDGKGSKDRITMLPDRLVEPLKTHRDKVAALHKRDL